jgi:hypothetical protein
MATSPKATLKACLAAVNKPLSEEIGALPNTAFKGDMTLSLLIWEVLCQLSNAQFKKILKDRQFKTLCLSIKEEKKYKPTLR